MSSKTNIIGRIGVRVAPDTTGFKQRLRTLLSTIEKELDRITIDLDLDDKGLARKVEAAVAEMQATAGDVKIPLDFDMDQSVRDAREQMNEMLTDARRKLRLDIGWDKEKVDRELQKLKDKYDGDEIEFQAAIDSLLARAELARVARDRIVMLHVTVSKRSLAAASTAIAALSGARLAADSIRRLWDNLKELDKSLPAIAAVTTAIQLLSAFIATGFSNTVALVSSLMEIGALALLLPGIATAFAVGIGASVAVFKDFNAVIPELGERLGKLQDVMSAQFWTQAEGPIRHLIDDLFPEFSAGMLDVTDSLGGFFANLADALREKLGGRMGAMFTNLAESIDIASGSGNALAGIIETLGTKGSEYLPRLAEWFKRNVVSLDEWLRSASESGEFDRWVERAIENTSALGSFLFDLGGTIYTLGSAAEEAGGAGIQQLAETMGKIRDVVESPSFLSKYKRFIGISHDFFSIISGGIGDSFSNFISSLADDLMYAMESMGPAIGQALGAIFDGLSSDKFSQGLRDLFDGLAEGLKGFTPFIVPILGGLGSLLSIIGVMAEQFLPVLGEVLAFVAEVLTEHGPKIEELIIALSDAFLELLENHGDDIKEILGHVLDFLVKLAPYAPALLIGAAGFKLLGGALKLFKPLAGPIGSLIKLAGAKWGGLGGMLKTLGGSGLLRAAGAIGLIAGFLKVAWDNSEYLRKSVGPLVSALGGLFGQLWGMVTSFLTPLIGGVGDFLGLAFRGIGLYIEAITLLLKGDWSGALEKFKEIFDAEFIDKFWEDTGKKADEWWADNFEPDAKGSLSDAFEKVAKRGIESFTRGLQDGMPAAVREMGEGFTRGLTEQNFGSRGKAIGLAVNRGLSQVSLESTGRALGRTFVKGFGDVSGSGSGRGLAGEVRKGLAEVSAAATGRSFANGFLRGINGVSGTKAGSTLAGEARNGLSVNTYSRGRSFANDFAAGIRAKASQDAVRRATSTIAGIARGGLPGSPAEWGPLSGSGWSRVSGRSLSDDFAQGIMERRDSVLGATESIATAASNGLSGKALKTISGAVDVNHQQELVLANAPITLTVDGQQMRGYITQQAEEVNSGEALRVRYGRRG